MKKLLVFLILIFAFSVSVSAQDNIYVSQVEKSGLNGTAEQLSDETRQILQDLGLDEDNGFNPQNLDSANVFSKILSFFKDGGKAPFKAMLSMIAVMILLSLTSFAAEKSAVNPALSYVFALVICGTAVFPIISCITSAASAAKGTGLFMLSFVPVFAGIVVSSGAGTTGVGMSALLLFAAETVVQTAAFVIVPLMSAYLALGVASGVSPLINSTGISESVKKIAVWVLTLSFTLFLGLLSVQTTINATADSMSVKTLKFLVGSFVPVAGTALSESITTVGGALTLLRNSAAIYAVVAVCAILLPVIAEMLLWRLSLMLSGMVAGVLGVPKAPQILKSLDTVLAVMIGILLFIGALFTISLGAVMSIVKT